MDPLEYLRIIDDNQEIFVSRYTKVNCYVRERGCLKIEDF